MRGWQSAQRSLIRGRGILLQRAFTTSVPQCGGKTVAHQIDCKVDTEEVSVKGWVRSVRKQKRVAFAAVSDGSTLESLQAVLRPDDAVGLSAGAAVDLKGDWKASVGSGQSHELHVSSATVLGENDAENNPLQPKYQSPEYLRTIPHLRARIPANALLLRLRSHLIASITTFFNREDFIQTHTPIITSSDCEGAGEVFDVCSNVSSDSVHKSESHGESQPGHFFRQPKYLTVSAQLHLEALASAVNRVWTLSPTFRAEQSDTPRHLSEFYMLEAEMCFVNDVDKVMNLVENMLRSSVTELSHMRIWTEILKVRASAMDDGEQVNEKLVSPETLQQRWDGMMKRHWTRITYSEAIELLRNASSSGTATFTFKPTYEDGLQAEHERYIATEVGKGSPVFVTDYPRVQKPFYMLPSTPATNNQGATDTVACFDLLVPDLCELAGGSLREHRSNELLAEMEAKAVAGKDLEWYQDLRQYGGVPHGGFGLGFDRLLCYLAGVSNVRDVVAFPRWYGRCDC